MTDYRQLTPILRDANRPEPPALDALERDVAAVFDAYQASRYGYVTARTPLLLAYALRSADGFDGDAGLRAQALLAMTYQAAASILTKLGEADLAWYASDRGLAAAQRSGHEAVTGSLFRSVTHTLLATGRYRAAVQLTTAAADYLAPALPQADDRMLSVYGSLFLAGAMASSRMDDRETTRDFLTAAGDTARRLGGDANHMWTAFGPTNVDIHRVATAMELGDVQIAVDVGPQLDTTRLPVERCVRHSIEVARAYSARNRRDNALDVLLGAETLAPEQVRHHFLSRRLVAHWMKTTRGPVSSTLADFAHRLCLSG